MSDLLERWDSLLQDAPRRISAGHLYVGRAIVEAKFVTQLLSAGLYIVSAGLGLIRETDMVPNYDLTVGSNSTSLKIALKNSGERTSHWWKELTGRATTAGTLADLICAVPNRMVFIALPATYLQMVCEDLGSIKAGAAPMLRIFTSEVGRSGLPEHLRPYALQYDERLESLDGYDGTRAEFPQRALRHFVEALGGHQLALHDAQAAVKAALSELKMRTVPTREKATDAQISSILREQWASHSGCSSRLLRYLRDKALIACEQSRFRALWLKAKSEYDDRKESVHAA